MLLSDGANLTLDSIVYGIQTPDVSMGRCPDGTGALGPRATPTFNAYNCPLAAAPTTALGELTLFPNPADDMLHIRLSEPYKGEILAYDQWGQQILSQRCEEIVNLDLKNWNPGVYTIRIGSFARKIVVVH